MCRLFAITATNMDPQRKIQALDRLMLLHTAAGNDDGWGICDTKFVHKNTGMYLDPAWMEKTIDASGIMFGHTRYASSNTGLNMKESHPFALDNLTGMHNGLMQNTGVSVGEMPDSDSFRALKRLSDAMGDHPITKELIERWLQTFWDNSSFAFMIYADKKLHVFRNEKRMLFIAQIGDGYIIATTEIGIQAVRGLFPDVTGDTIQLPTRTLFTFEAGKPYKAVPLSYTMRQVPFGIRIENWIAQRKKELPWQLVNTLRASKK